MKLIYLLTTMVFSLLLPASLASAEDYISPYASTSAAPGATSSTALDTGASAAATSPVAGSTSASATPASTSSTTTGATGSTGATGASTADTVITVPGTTTALTAEQFLAASCSELVKPGVLYPLAQEPAYRWQRAFFADLSKAYAAGGRIAKKGGLGATARKLYQKNLTLVVNREKVVEKLRAEYQKNLLDCLNRQSELRYEQALLVLTTTREQTATTTSQTTTTLDIEYKSDLQSLQGQRKVAIKRLYGVKRSQIKQVLSLKKMPGGKKLAIKRAKQVLAENKRNVNARHQGAVAKLKAELEANKLAQAEIEKEAVRVYESEANKLKLEQEMAEINNNSQATTIPEKHYANLSTSIGESERGEVEMVYDRTERLIERLSLRKLRNYDATHDPKGGVPKVDWSQVTTEGTFNNGQPAAKLNRQAYDASALVTKTESEIAANRAALKKAKGAKAKRATAKSQTKGYQRQISSLSSQVGSGPGINSSDSPSDRAAKRAKYEAQKARLAKIKKEYNSLMKDYAVYEKAAKRDAKIYRSEKKKFDNYGNKFSYDTRAVGLYENMNEAEKRSQRSSGYFKKTARRAAVAQHAMITHLEKRGSKCNPGSTCYSLKVQQRDNPQAGLGHGTKAVEKAKKSKGKKK